MQPTQKTLAISAGPSQVDSSNKALSDGTNELYLIKRVTKVLNLTADELEKFKNCFFSSVCFFTLGVWSKHKILHAIAAVNAIAALDVLSRLSSVLLQEAKELDRLS